MENRTLYDDLKDHGIKELSQEEELALLRKSQSGDLQATHTLLSTLYFTVISVAAKAAGDSTPPDMFDDILSAGIEGALTAIRRHNLSPTTRLRTFANAHIRGMCLREISKTYSPLSVPHNGVVEAIKLKEGASAEDLGITDTKAFSLKAASLPQAEFALNDPQDELAVQEEFEVHLRAALDQLPPDQHFVVAHSVGILGFSQMTKKEIANAYGLQPREVTALHNDGLLTLQQFFELA